MKIEYYPDGFRMVPENSMDKTIIHIWKDIGIPLVKFSESQNYMEVLFIDEPENNENIV